MKGTEKKLFISFSLQNEFHGSSAPGDVGVHGLTVSDKYRLSSQRTTSQHHLLYGQRHTGRRRMGNRIE